MCGRHRTRQRYYTQHRIIPPDAPLALLHNPPLNITAIQDSHLFYRQDNQRDLGEIYFGAGYSQKRVYSSSDLLAALAGGLDFCLLSLADEVHGHRL